MEQICFFDPIKEMTYDDKIGQLKERLDNARRGFFKRYDIYQKELERVELEMQQLIDCLIDATTR
jgi:hypothetical protein